MKKHRVAHLGLGGRGKIYVRPYLDSDRFDLVGGCDLDRTKRNECADGRLIGVQFHPERMPKTIWVKLFEYLVKRAAE